MFQRLRLHPAMELSVTSELIGELTDRTGVSLDDFDSIVHLYRLKIFRFLLASLRDRDAAETLTQDCFFKAYRARGTFRGECGVDTWLMQIAVNLVRDHAKSRRLQFWRKCSAGAASLNQDRDCLASDARSTETLAALRQAVQGVWDAAAKLPERQRTVFLLRFVEDMDLLEIAAATGISQGTVKTHLSRALHAVREELGVTR